MGVRAILVVIGAVLLLTGQASRAEPFAPGVNYAFYNAAGPNRVHVISVDRLRSEYKLKVGWPQKKRNFTARETVSAIASAYDVPPTHDVLAAVNASFFSTPPSITGTAASDGEMLAQPGGGNEVFMFGPTRLPMIREAITHVNGRLTFADATTATLHGYNRARLADEVVAYTPQWGPTTGTTGEGVEIVLVNVSYPMRGHKEVAGIVTAVRTAGDSVNNEIPAGGMVISAVGTPAGTIASKVQVGQHLYLFFDTSDGNCNNADMAITGIGYLVKDGAANTASWTQDFAVDRHPRTVLAWNNTTLFMMVCDGRCNGIVGMTFQELADFLILTLGATDAINLDGGGSTTMWANGFVRNLPSDSCGTERAVANAILLVREDTATQFPFFDAFTSAGRSPGWDDKFTYNPIQSLSPAAPGGDGYVINVQDPSGGVETVRRGDFGDTNYCVEADIYCQYRSNVASNGYERYAIFARDSGAGGMGLSASNSYGPGNCYALTYDSDTGRIRAAKYVNGTISDFLNANRLYMPSTGWHKFRIECVGTTIRYLVDGTPIADVTDSSHGRGYFGIGYQDFFSNNANIRGTRADNFAAHSAPAPAWAPQPANGATGVPLDANLIWMAGTDAASHDVYFGTTSPGEFNGNQAGTTFVPGSLQRNQTYFWRVDEVNAFGVATGQAWSFRTERYKGDFDDDGDADQEDFGRFQVCLTGTIAPQTDPACDRAKLDPVGNPDDDVDNGDLEAFLRCMSRPGVSPTADCIE